MKKIMLIICMLLICFSLFAVAVCVYPADAGLEKLLGNVYPHTKINHFNMTVSNDMLLEHNFRLMEMMGKKSSSEILLFPVKENMSDFSHYVIYSYDISSGNFRKIYEKLYQGSLEYNMEMIESMAYLFQEIHPDRNYDKNDSQSLKINLEAVKNTVLTSSRYTHDSENYNKARNKFYKSFARTLGVFGAGVLLRSFNYNSQTAEKGIDLSAKVGVGVSCWFLYKDLKNYIKSIEF